MLPTVGLQDVQGKRIPPGVRKVFEVSLRDIKSRKTLLKEKMIFISKENQPILFYRRWIEYIWGINGREQIFEKGD